MRCERNNERKKIKTLAYLMECLYVSFLWTLDMLKCLPSFQVFLSSSFCCYSTLALPARRRANALLFSIYNPTSISTHPFLPSPDKPHINHTPQQTHATPSDPPHAATTPSSTPPILPPSTDQPQINHPPRVPMPHRLILRALQQYPRPGHPGLKRHALIPIRPPLQQQVHRFISCF